MSTLILTISQDDYDFLEELHEHLHTWAAYFSGLDKVYAKKDAIRLESVLNDLSYQIKNHV